MQPKLQGNTFYLPTTEGIYLRNNQETLTLKGQDIYQWISALEPYLDGQSTLEALVDDLEPEQQVMVRDIVETLLAHGFLKDCSHDLPHTLDERALVTYATEIAFIDSFHDSAAALFEHFCGQRVLIIGSGLTALALVHATLQAGVRQTTFWITDECETHTSRLLAYRQEAQARDAHQELFEQPSPDWHDEDVIRESLQSFDVILHLSDRPMLQRALMLNALCFDLQKPLFQALLLNDHALVGPVVTGAPGCWECAWRRELANPDATEQRGSLGPWQNDLTTPVSPLLALPTAATVANILSFECFKYLTASGPSEITGQMLRFDLETLRFQSHLFLPHPLCQVCQHLSPLTEAAFLEHIRDLEKREALKEELFNQQAVRCFDSSLGIFPFLGEDDLVQMPLNVSRLTVSAPMNPELPQKTLTLTQAHQGFDTTRRLLTFQGCSLYAARLVDRRRLVADAGRIGVWAYDLQARNARLVSEAQAFLLSDDLQQIVPTSLGVSAGLSWAEACARALLDHALALTVQEVSLGEARYAEIAPNTLGMDPRGKHLYTFVEQTGKQLRVYHVTSALQIPTLAFCIENETLVYTTHFDVAQALNEGLERVVQQAQSRQAEQPVYALPAVPQLTHAARGDLSSFPANPAPRGWQEGLDWLIAAFHRQHWCMLAVLLDHDTALSALIPFLVRLLLIREK